MDRAHIVFVDSSGAQVRVPGVRTGSNKWRLVDSAPRVGVLAGDEVIAWAYGDELGFGALTERSRVAVVVTAVDEQAGQAVEDRLGLVGVFGLRDDSVVAVGVEPSEVVDVVAAVSDMDVQIRVVDAEEVGGFSPFGVRQFEAGLRSVRDEAGSPPELLWRLLDGDRLPPGLLARRFIQVKPDTPVDLGAFEAVLALTDGVHGVLPVRTQTAGAGTAWTEMVVSDEVSCVWAFRSDGPDPVEGVVWTSMVADAGHDTAFICCRNLGAMHPLWDDVARIFRETAFPARVVDLT